MKKRFAKYIILIFLTFLASIWIYNYVEEATPVDTESDIIAFQSEKENEYFGNTNFTIDDPKVILNPYGNSPLTAIVIFQTKDLTTASITIAGKDGSKDLTHTFMPSKTHILPIYGLYADYENKVTINVNGNSKEVIVKTDALPEDFFNVISVDSKIEDEFYFTTPEDTGYTAAVDSKGNVRWYIIGDYKWDIQRLNNGHILMSSDKTVSKNYSAGLVEMDLLGKVYFEYAIPGGYHHSVFELPDGNLLASSNNVNGNSVEDYAVVVDRNTGSIIKEIDFKKILKSEKDGNWFKLTSLVYDSSTNSITASGYNNDVIVNIDYSSMDINWIIGNNVPDNLKKYSLHNSNMADLPSKPESIKLLGNNEIMFINHLDSSTYSTTYKLDYSNFSFSQTGRYELSSFENAYLDINDDNDYIITQGKEISEVLNGKRVMNIGFTSPLYNTKKMSLYANDIYTGVLGTRLGSLGESKVSKDFSLIGSKKDSKLFNKYNLKLYKDVYGLKVSGEFEEDDNVQIVLDNVLDKKTYDLDIDGKVSSRYINEDGIKGKYYIYIRINGRTYKTLKYAQFK